MLAVASQMMQEPGHGAANIEFRMPLVAIGEEVLRTEAFCFQPIVIRPENMFENTGFLTKGCLH